jgi:prepilin-type N-terminal cleavage/methylation domain-containing protein
MKNISYKIREDKSGFTLAEVLTALVIASMVLVTVVGIYSRAESVAATITRRFESSKLPTEVLQRIAEDLDRIIASDSNIEISIINKFEQGYPTAQLTITKTIVDAEKTDKVFEQIVWQTNYDYDANGLVLYRQRTSEIGLLEDKLLDEEREGWEQELFVPICEGITFFRVQALNNGQYVDKWSGRVPPGIELTISFAEPFQTLDNTFDVYDDQKFARTVAVDRTRKMKFKVVPKEKQEPGDSLTKEADEPTKTDETKKADETQQKIEEVEKMLNLPEKVETRSKR